jgi:hypothetical protein
MNSNSYLKKILEHQTFSNDDHELKDLRQRRNDIEKKLRTYFSTSAPSICWAGSMAKGTMICESYDGDMTCYFSEEEEKAGRSLKEIYETVEKSLQEGYQVERKASALRVKDKQDRSNDLHIDVVPGRYTDETKSDVFLHRTIGDKQRLKTNLQTHIDHIRDSGVTDAIRLMKLWKVRNGLDTAKTFVLELLVVKLLKDKKALDLSTQLRYVWTEFRDKPDNLFVEDPANSNNDLRFALNDCRSILAVVAGDTLWQIENKGWEVVFGEIEDENEASGDESQTALLQAAVSRVAIPTQPWLQGK